MNHDIWNKIQGVDRQALQHMRDVTSAQADLTDLFANHMNWFKTSSVWNDEQRRTSA